MYLIYGLVTSLLAPVAALFLGVQAKHRPLLRRFSPLVPESDSRPIWVQAVSVGEVRTVKPILEALQSRWPGIPLVLTVSTVSGWKLAQETCGGLAGITWFPVDHPLCVGRFVSRLRPRMLILLETELWPAAIRETRRFGAPVAILNGRLSDKHYARYHRWRLALRPMFRGIATAAVQTDEHRDRLVSLGVDPSLVVVTGNVKFEGATTMIDANTIARLKQEIGFSGAGPVLIFGSTRPGDEELAASCWKRLRERHPGLCLIVAPRHLERLQEAVDVFGKDCALRSQLRNGDRPRDPRVVILDTVGELVSFYGLAAVAVVGGSFFPGVDGHNPIEPAALGVPTVFGPYMANFKEPARVLVEGGAAVQVSGPETLARELESLLDDSERRQTLGAAGRRVVAENQGAIARSLDVIAPFLDS